MFLESASSPKEDSETRLELARRTNTTLEESLQNASHFGNKLSEECLASHARVFRFLASYPAAKLSFSVDEAAYPGGTRAKKIEKSDGANRCGCVFLNQNLKPYEMLQEKA